MIRSTKFNKFNLLFCNKANWESKKRLIRNRKELHQNAAIASTVNQINESLIRRKRTMTNEQAEARQKKARDRCDFIKKVTLITPNTTNDSQTSLVGDSP
jgi:hypothetical protein